MSVRVRVWVHVPVLRLLLFCGGGWCALFCCSVALTPPCSLFAQVRTKRLGKNIEKIAAILEAQAEERRVEHERGLYRESVKTGGVSNKPPRMQPMQTAAATAEPPPQEHADGGAAS